MSHQATNWAVTVKGIPATAKIVLWHLADRHNKDTGRCDPNQETLAKDCEISRSSLNNQLRTLETAGLITRFQRVNSATKRQQSTAYVLLFDIRKPKDTESRVQNLGTGAVSKSETNPCPNSEQSRVQNLDTNPVREPGTEPVCAADAAQDHHLFSEFWNSYPRLRDRAKTSRLFSESVQAGADPKHIVASARKYAQENEGNGMKFVKFSGTWLSDGRWKDFDFKDGGTNRKAALVEFWAERIKAKVHIPTTAISPSIVREMLDRGLVQPDELQQAGVGF